MTVAEDSLASAILDYVEAHVSRHGRKRTAEAFGVSRHTLWRFLQRGHLGRSLLKAVLNTVGGTVEALEAATLKLSRHHQSPSRADPFPRLSEQLEDTLLLISATPMATARELSTLVSVSISTYKARLRKLTDLGLVDSVAHRLATLSLRPHRRYHPTGKGIVVAAYITQGLNHVLSSYPVSRRWFQLLAERLNAVAVLYHTAAMVAAAAPRKKSLRMDPYRQGPYEMLITFSERQAIGVMRQGPSLSTANFRYRLRSMEMLPLDKKHTVTLVLTHSDQAIRRAIRTLGDHDHHNRTFVATEGEFLAWDHEATVWQRCGEGSNNSLPAKIDPSVSLSTIVPWMDQTLEASEFYQRATGYRPPDPDDLYTYHKHTGMPEPREQLTSSLTVQLTAAEKQALDLLAAWPLCTKHQLAGLMGGVTRRRAPRSRAALTSANPRLLRYSAPANSCSPFFQRASIRFDRRARLGRSGSAKSSGLPVTIGGHRTNIVVRLHTRTLFGIQDLGLRGTLELHRVYRTCRHAARLRVPTPVTCGCTDLRTVTTRLQCRQPLLDQSSLHAIVFPHPVQRHPQPLDVGRECVLHLLDLSFQLDEPPLQPIKSLEAASEFLLQFLQLGLQLFVAPALTLRRRADPLLQRTLQGLAHPVC